MVRNVNPLLNISKGDTTNWMSKYHYYAYGEIYWEWRLWIQGYGYPLGTVDAVVRGDRYGHSYGWSYRIN